MLSAASCRNITVAQSCGEARRTVLGRPFDLIIINAPLVDESGEGFACDVAANGITQVILVVGSEHFDAVSAATEDSGVLTVAKPVNRIIFWSALKFAMSAHNRMTQLKTENSKLSRKIEDIRIVDRAKCILIAYLKVSEQEAHRYIEKQAMDMRVTKRMIAEEILKTYENANNR